MLCGAPHSTTRNGNISECIWPVVSALFTTNLINKYKAPFTLEINFEIYVNYFLLQEKF